MCIFVDQHGNIAYRYPTYTVDEVSPFEPQMRIRPNNRINLVAPGPGGPQQHLGNWGMDTGQFDWNARDDRLATSPLWRSMWGQPGHHVVLPITHGYEATTRHGGRRWFAVERHDREPMLIAGLGRVQEGKHRTEWHVTMVTTDAGPVFAPIHDTPREIVVLRDWTEAQEWLAAKDPDRLRKLLRPAGTDLLRSYRVHDDVFKEKFPAEKCSDPYQAPKPKGLDRFA